MLKLGDVLEALCGQHPSGVDLNITGAVHDSRHAQPGNLFVALKGERVDGHDFVAEAFAKGAVLALVQHEITGNYQTLDFRSGKLATNLSFARPSIILVDDSLLALQKVASFWRRKLDIRVIGITGSVGKTTTKELTAEVLSQCYVTFKSTANYNNEIGLPLARRVGDGFLRSGGDRIVSGYRFACDRGHNQYWYRPCRTGGFAGSNLQRQSRTCRCIAKGGCCHPKSG
jgi:UDP-N-acetylmuramoyl-tripeptide--D-alanyl-D-alanine ligase